MVSKRFLQVTGAALLVMTIGIVSCQALFAQSSPYDTGHDWPSSAVVRPVQ